VVLANFLPSGLDLLNCVLIRSIASVVSFLLQLLIVNVLLFAVLIVNFTPTVAVAVNLAFMVFMLFLVLLFRMGVWQGVAMDSLNVRNFSCHSSRLKVGRS
jgi:membrane protein YdbS with pleckstrin-like domain